MRISLTPKSIFKSLCVIILTLVLLNILGIMQKELYNNNYLNFIGSLFYLDNEMNVPSFFSATLLLICFILTAIISFNYKQDKAKNRYWLGLAMVFLFLSCDEISAIHEHFTNLFRVLLNTSGYLWYAWVIPYGIFLILMLALYLKFFLKLPTRTKKYILLSGCIFLLGSIGIEMITANIDFLRGEENAAYYSLMTLEETFEMFGVSLFIYTLLLYINDHLGALLISIQKE